MYTEMRVIMGDNNWSYSKYIKKLNPMRNMVCMMLRGTMVCQRQMAT